MWESMCVCVCENLFTLESDVLLVLICYACFLHVVIVTIKYCRYVSLAVFCLCVCVSVHVCVCVCV